MPAGATYFPGVGLDTIGSPSGFSQVENLAYTKLTADASASTLTLNVTSTAGFPSTPSVIVCGREVIWYGAKTATTFTGCVRGHDGTTAAIHAKGATVGIAVVAAHHNDLAAAIVAIETVLGLGISTPYGVMRKIAEASGTGASGVIEFASIPQTYRTLLLSTMSRTDAAAAAVAISMTFETSPTAGAYNGVLTRGNGTTASAGTTDNASSIQVGSATGTTGSANTPCVGMVWLPEYAQTNLFKCIVGQTFGTTTIGPTGFFSDVFGGLYESTAAINRIRLTLGSGNWTTTSRVTLYGIPG